MVTAWRSLAYSIGTGPEDGKGLRVGRAPIAACLDEEPALPTDAEAVVWRP
ncbi:hypothetical protein BH24CHL4_BH24CHL4_17260 [soil metagenome]